MSLSRPLRMVPRAAAALAAMAALLLVGCGTGAPVASESPALSAGLDAPSSGRDVRKVAVAMNDTFRFEPERIEVTAGETIRFEVSNVGAIVHEFYVGDDAAQVEREREMQSGGMTHHDPNGVGVGPGETKAFEMTFAKGEDLLIGCHEPGHYTAGMCGTLHISE
jgi:uncharacterized cupredoxin-like copper-binding protein